MSNEEEIKKYRVDDLGVKVFSTRQMMGQAAARDVAERIRKLLSTKDRVSIIFAAAPSQDEFLAALSEEKNIDWSKITALHLDEYIGLDTDASQRFSKYLDQHIFDIVKPGKVHYIVENDIADEDILKRYKKILKDNPPDIACIGIGENGHIAFNDPPVADFDDQKLIKIVELDNKCRRQQVHDGCFDSIEKVPELAYNLTVPAIITADFIACVARVPQK